MTGTKTTELATTATITDFLVNGPTGTRKMAFAQAKALLAGDTGSQSGRIDASFYGATPAASQTPSQRRTALQTAINAAAVLGLTLFIGAGVWEIDSDLNLVSNSHIVGAGPRLTRIKLSSAASASKRVLFCNGIEDFSVKSLAVDGNVERLAAATGAGAFAGGILTAGQKINVTIPCAGVLVSTLELTAIADNLPPGVVLQKIGVAGAVNVTILNTSESPVTCPSLLIRVGRYAYAVGPETAGCGFAISSSKRGTLHDIRGIQCAKHCLDIGSSLNGYSLGTGINSYAPAPSQWIYVSNGYFEGGGDDNVTTHGSEYLFFDNIHSQSSNANYIADNSNGMEIDDQSRYVFVSNCTFLNVNNPIEIKGHVTAAAANHVFITSVSAAYCVGFDIHHTGHGTTGNPSTPTGGQIVINGLFLRNMTGMYFRCWAYRDVFITGLIMEDNGTNADGRPFSIENGTSNVSVNGFTMRGFSNLIGNGLFIQDSASEKVSVSNGIICGGSQSGIYIGSGVDNVVLDNILIKAPAGVSNTAPAIYSYSGVTPGGLAITNCRQTGYTVEIRRGATIAPLRDTYGRGQQFVGSVFMGECTEDIRLSTALQEGVSYIYAEALGVSRNNATALYVRRSGDEGTILIGRRDNISVGNISVTATSMAFNTTSDARFKDDKGMLDPVDAAAILRLIKIHNFEWKSPSKIAGKKDIGAFAQELFEVYPAAVTVGIGEPGDDDFVPWAVDLGKLTPQLIVAWQNIDIRLLAIERQLKGRVEHD
jgi:hypothetical protein